MRIAKKIAYWLGYGVGFARTWLRFGLTYLWTHLFWVFWGVCTGLAVAFIIMGAYAWTWIVYALLFAVSSIVFHIKHMGFMREADALLNSIDALANRHRKTGARYLRALNRRGALLEQKEEQLDKIMMGIAAGKGRIERVQIVLDKEDNDA